MKLIQKLHVTGTCCRAGALAAIAPSAMAAEHRVGSPDAKLVLIVSDAGPRDNPAAAGLSFTTD